jgi:hypothetical protein
MGAARLSHLSLLAHLPLLSTGPRLSASRQSGRATLHAMHRARAYFFAYFWFSPRPAAGEANA